MTIALVPFSGRAGRGGSTGVITLTRVADEVSLEVERWSGRNALALALEGPVWDRYGSFAGHPSIQACVAWIPAERCIVITGDRGGEAFEEVLT